MIRSTASKVMWVGRATVFLVGLSVILALVFGVASAAFGANWQNFILGKLNNAATKVTGLVGNVDGAAALRVTNPNAGTNDTALDLRVQAGEAPMRVNSTTRVAKLNAATAGWADSADTATNAQNADDAGMIDGIDSTRLVQGEGDAKSGAMFVPAGTSAKVLDHSGHSPHIEVYLECPSDPVTDPSWKLSIKNVGESDLRTWFDNGSTDPNYWFLSPNAAYPEAVIPEDHITYGVQGAGAGTIEVFTGPAPSPAGASACSVWAQGLFTNP